MTAGSCDVGACETCTFGCATVPRRGPDDASTIAASGVAVAVLAVVLAVTGSGVPAAIAVVAALSGLAPAGLGVLARRRAGAARERLVVAGAAAVPWSTALLLVAVVARVATFLLP